MNISQFLPATTRVIVSKFIHEEVMRSKGRALPEVLLQLCKAARRIDLRPSQYMQDNMAMVYLQGETLPHVIKMEPKNSKKESQVACSGQKSHPASPQG